MDHKLTEWMLAGCLGLLVAVPCQSQQRHASLEPPAGFASQQWADGATLMQQVVARIDQHATVSAKVRHQVHLFNQKLVGSGVYLQRQSEQGTQVHFGLSVKAGERLVSLLQVSDGRFLYLRDNLDDRLKLGRIDLQRLRRAGVGEDDTLSPSLGIGGGGLPQLLRSIATNFHVAPPQSVVFQSVPVWTLACTWDPQRLVEYWPPAAELLDEQGRLDTERLPEQFPDRIFLLVGQDDLFPYRVDYRRSQPSDRLSRLAGDDEVSQSITTLELYEVQFDAPLDPLLFAYKPGNEERLDDRTDDYLVRVKQRAAKQSAAKKAAATEPAAKKPAAQKTAAAARDHSSR